MKFNVENIKKLHREENEKKKQLFYKECSDALEYMQNTIIKNAINKSILFKREPTLKIIFSDDYYLNLTTKHFIDLGFKVLLDFEDVKYSQDVTIIISWFD